MKIGYLMNTYPITSTTFIRREIRAHEAAGTEVRRYAIRAWDGPLVDPADRAEKERTTYLLDGQLPRLLGAALREAAGNPRGLWRAARLMLRLRRRALRGNTQASRALHGNTNDHPLRGNTQASRALRGKAGGRSGGTGGTTVRHAAYLLEAIRFRQLAARDGIGHVHAHFSTNSAAVAMLSRAMGGPGYSFTVHGPDELDDPRAGALDDKVRAARFVVAISDYCRGVVRRESAPDQARKVHVVRCGIDLAEFEEPDAADAPEGAPQAGAVQPGAVQPDVAPASDPRATSGPDAAVAPPLDPAPAPGTTSAPVTAPATGTAPGTAPVTAPDTAPDPGPLPRSLVCVGRLCPQKAQTLLVEAAALLRDSHPDLRIVLIGDGETRPEIEAGIARHGIAPMIELRGWGTNDEVRAALRAARALVLPSLAEGLPVVIMEALATARPVISTRITGIPELVDASCGWIVPPGDAAALARAIAACLDAPDAELRAMGRVGRARVRAMHDQARNAAALRDLIRAAAPA